MDGSPIQDTIAQLPQPVTAPSQELGRDDFLQLLVAKLANQDPLSPTSDTEFVAELATFSSLEQLMGANQRLDGLALGQAELVNAQTVDLIGKRVLVESDGTLQVRNGVVDDLVYEVPRQASDVELILRNDEGQIARTIELDPSPQGRVTLRLDDGSRTPLPDGEYSIEVRATDAQGGSMEIGLFRLFPIDGVQFADGLIRLVSADRILGFGDILEIHRGQDNLSDR